MDSQLLKQAYPCSLRKNIWKTGCRKPFHYLNSSRFIFVMPSSSSFAKKIEYTDGFLCENVVFMRKRLAEIATNG
jgi:hypothetical protein